MAHPLTLLRTAMGVSQAEYAGLVARAHADLGLGQMAARREKVSRWEAGRIVPERSAQLAMARIHGVPAGEVRRLGWPHWLHLAGAEAAEAGTGTPHDGRRPSAEDRWSAFALQGPALAARLTRTLALLGAAGPGSGRAPGREGPPLREERLQWTEARTTALEQHENGTLVPLGALYAAALAEHRLAVHLVTTTGYDGPTARRLLRLVSRTALVCAWLASTLGQEPRAERHNLAAVRAAAAAGDTGCVSAALAQLANRHIIAGDAADALAVVRAARLADPHPAPGGSAGLHLKEAIALARLGEGEACARALDRAEAVAGTPDDRHPPDPSAEFDLHERYLPVARATAWLHLGRPRRAQPYFGPLTHPRPPASAAPPSPYTALALLYTLDAHLALGELGPAATTVHHAIDVTGVLPPGIALRYRERLAPHRHEPLIAGALDHLADGAP
ncbi:hypothetical protein ACFXDE_19645 [Kitasatospora sp. NPDC059408]|uniref:hypothetical protein n=1 Tax=Kitasatospora sp. NPDC059408 TaxID=3346823 RepID=UPI0036A1CB2E